MIPNIIEAGMKIVRASDGQKFRVLNYLGNGMITVQAITQHGPGLEEIVKIKDLEHLGFSVVEEGIRIRITDEFLPTGSSHIILLDKGSDTDGMFMGEIRREKNGFARQADLDHAFDLWMDKVRKITEV